MGGVNIGDSWAGGIDIIDNSWAGGTDIVDIIINSIGPPKGGYTDSIGLI